MRDDRARAGRSCAVLVAIGIDAKGRRSILGVSVSLSEAEAHWRDFLASLQERGLHGVKLVVSDAHAGLKPALDARLTGVPWQRCQFHLIENAMAFVPKPGMRKVAVASIRAVAASLHYISPEISSYLVNRMERASSLAEARPGLHTLTPTERQIVRLIADKKTSKEIADELCISPRTVDNHRNNICRKLDLHGINALLKFALEHRSDLV